MSDTAVEKAQAAAMEARGQFYATAQEIQSRLEPSRLFDDAMADVRSRSAKMAQTAGDTVRERPAAIAVAATIGALIGAHRPLARLGNRLFGRRKKLMTPPQVEAPEAR